MRDPADLIEADSHILLCPLCADDVAAARYTHVERVYTRLGSDPNEAWVYQGTEANGCTEIVSPGGFPVGISAENIIRKQSPRNRRIAEACARCGLVERSGQGADRMFEETIREGKPKPDFSGTDEYEVRLTLHGEIQNPQFLRFLEKAAAEEQVSFTVEDLLVLDALQLGVPVPPEFRSSLNQLLERGIVERIGKGRGVRFVLSRRFYSFLGRPGSYTRTRGLDRETQKALLVKHIRDASPQGARLKDMQDVLKELSRNQIQTLLRELRAEGKIRVEGVARAGLWYPT